MIGHPLPSCLLSKGLVLILTAFSSCLKLRAHPGHPAPYEPSLPVPLISLLPANLQTLIQKAVVLVKVLLRQVRVVFQTRCRFVWELDWSLSPAVCWGRRGNGALCSARLPPHRSRGTALGVPKPDRSLSATKPRLHGAPPNSQCEHLTFSCTVSSQTFSAEFFCHLTPLAHEGKR